MTSKKKPKTGRTARRAPVKKSPKVSLEIPAEIVLDTIEMWSKRSQSLKDSVAYYRSELEGDAENVFYLSTENALSLLADTVPVIYSVDRFKMVLRYTEALGFFLTPLL